MEGKVNRLACKLVINKWQGKWERFNMLNINCSQNISWLHVNPSGVYKTQCSLTLLSKKEFHQVEINQNSFKTLKRQHLKSDWLSVAHLYFKI